jgi:hypothetical protein
VVQVKGVTLMTAVCRVRVPALVAVSASILLVLTPAIQADPMTFNFSGTLPGGGYGAVYGTNQFTGSVTFDSNPIVSGGISSPKSVMETGSDVSIMVDVAGHEIDFGNAVFSATQVWSPKFGVGGATYDAFGVVAGPSNDPYLTNISLGFGIQSDPLFSNVTAGQTINLRNFDFLDGLPGVSFGYGPGVGWAGMTEGTITSFEPAPIPEPSTLLIFAGMGVAAIYRHRSKGTRARG